MQLEVEGRLKKLKSYKSNFVLIVITALLSLVTLILFVTESESFINVSGYIKAGYMAFLVGLYVYILYRWKYTPLRMIKPILIFNLLQIATVKWGESSIGLNPFSAIGVSFNFDTFSITVNLLAIVMVGLTWRCKLFAKH
ncbi:hypothetical protein [Pseudoalteromonas luteoviolacea]|uniref:Uncharacterized protein n=1 Tax=Pseudoalteromonas luteoviolacea H33 TaxID=1365251 RepID=A0A167D584_9GAMM|nr:hypothetical protein [Pseudoalteromonas luteoviolacea]KZN48428.1 hypothetical protein N476_21390 [Pseudoalteromonas luteoviolacea H33]KZN73289.1 hypothetical protein N477_23490 [Pseudoalteromonas luteoviolacea H33-S]